jgi:hypothetical protein
MSKRPPDGRNMRVGHRLYLYASGHGFSANPTRACLIAGDANDLQKTNISPSAWIEWLQDQGCFHEHVLWMDACMDRTMFAVPSPAPVDPRPGSLAPPGASFVAFAAPRPLKALEKPFPPDDPAGVWRGLFTWNLVEGLRGAAVNAYGLVTGRSLADWLRRAQVAWFSEKERENLNYAKVPAIIQEEEALVFARGVERPRYPVTLTLAPGDWGRVRLWSGHPPEAGEWLQPDGDTLECRLAPGLYLAESEKGGLRHGFAVLRPGRHRLDSTGRPVAREDSLFPVLVNPEGADPQIRILSSGWCLVDSAVGTLDTVLPRGLYEIQVQIGRQQFEQVILLDRRFALREVPELPVASAAPLPGTSTSHPSHVAAAAREVGAVDVKRGEGAEILLMARCFFEAGAARGSKTPWEGVRLADEQGATVLDLEKEGKRVRRGDPCAVALAGVAPGNYELHFPGESGHLLAQSLIVPRGTRAEAYLMRAAVGGSSGKRPRLSLLMRCLDGSCEHALLIERLTVALADERSALGDDLMAALEGRFENPILGMVGGHLLLIAHEKGQDVRASRLDAVVANLRALVGDDHPDVEALSLYCADDRLRRSSPVTVPPIYERSWRLLVQASWEQPDLIPPALWAKVQATTTTPPFFHWSPDEAVRKSIGESLAKLVFATSEAEGPAAPPVDPATRARQHGLPPAAIDVLREQLQAGPR